MRNEGKELPRVCLAEQRRPACSGPLGPEVPVPGGFSKCGTRRAPRASGYWRRRRDCVRLPSPTRSPPPRSPLRALAGWWGLQLQKGVG